MDAGDYRAMTRQAKQKMKELKKNPFDLGYQGEWAGTDCSTEKIDDDRLECFYSKWKHKDKDAATDTMSKALQDKRRIKFGFDIKVMCKEESQVWCGKKELDGSPKDPDERCIKIKACQDPPMTITDMVDNFKEYYKNLMEALMFMNAPSKKKMIKN